MTVPLYNHIAGRNRERLAALSDGVFAFAMTVLVLDIRPPSFEAVHGEADLRHAYRAKWFGLIAADAPKGIGDSFVRCVIWAQLLYAAGAALCLVGSTWWSVAAIFVVQLVYVIGPRFWPLNRL
jgi:transmembrane protein TMEM174 (potassium channel)